MGSGGEGGAIPIPEGVLNASVREYYIDWRPEEPAVFTIECLDPPAPRRLEAAEMVARVRAARSHVMDSMEYWHDYLERKRREQPDNSFPPTLKLAKGLSFGRYENCYWRLEPGEALVIESAEPDARYWSAQLYLMDTFDLVDRFGRTSNRNQRQTRVSGDGHVASWTVMRPPTLPAFDDFVPFVILLVELDEGVRMVGYRGRLA